MSFSGFTSLKIPQLDEEESRGSESGSSTATRRSEREEIGRLETAIRMRPSVSAEYMRIRDGFGAKTALNMLFTQQKTLNAKCELAREILETSYEMQEVAAETVDLVWGKVIEEQQLWEPLGGEKAFGERVGYDVRFAKMREQHQGRERRKANAKAIVRGYWGEGWENRFGPKGGRLTEGSEGFLQMLAVIARAGWSMEAVWWGTDAAFRLRMQARRRGVSVKDEFTEGDLVNSKDWLEKTEEGSGRTKAEVMKEDLEKVLSQELDREKVTEVKVTAPPVTPRKRPQPPSTPVLRRKTTPTAPESPPPVSVPAPVSLPVRRFTLVPDPYVERPPPPKHTAPQMHTAAGKISDEREKEVLVLGEQEEERDPELKVVGWDFHRECFIYLGNCIYHGRVNVLSGGVRDLCKLGYDVTRFGLVRPGEELPSTSVHQEQLSSPLQFSTPGPQEQSSPSPVQSSAPGPQEQSSPQAQSSAPELQEQLPAPVQSSAPGRREQPSSPSQLSVPEQQKQSSASSPLSVVEQQKPSSSPEIPGPQEKSSVPVQLSVPEKQEQPHRPAQSPVPEEQEQPSPPPKRRRVLPSDSSTQTPRRSNRLARH